MDGDKREDLIDTIKKKMANLSVDELIRVQAAIKELKNHELNQGRR